MRIIWGKKRYRITDSFGLYWKIHYIYMFMYILSVPLIKFSILLFYRRIFGMNWAMWICFGLSGGYYVACTITLIVACQPISYYWTQVEDAKSGRCLFHPHVFYLGNAAANVVTDVLILLVPIPLVWKLQMPTSKKLLVCSLFLLGTLSVIPAPVVTLFFSLEAHS